MDPVTLPQQRYCPDCGQPQEWCDSPACGLEPGHWTHLGDAAQLCGRLGDRNRTGTEYMPSVMQVRQR